jgi:hypothetical protein
VLTFALLFAWQPPLPALSHAAAWVRCYLRAIPSGQHVCGASNWPTACVCGKLTCCPPKTRPGPVAAASVWRHAASFMFAPLTVLAHSVTRLADVSASFHFSVMPWPANEGEIAAKVVACYRDQGVVPARLRTPLTNAHVLALFALARCRSALPLADFAALLACASDSPVPNEETPQAVYRRAQRLYDNRRKASSAKNVGALFFVHKPAAKGSKRSKHDAELNSPFGGGSRK